jgi:hypothetical protein
LKQQDSILFERGFNQCDLMYLEDHMVDDLRFYHDQSGYQDREGFFDNTRKYICSNSPQKPIRKVDPQSLEAYPLYNNGELYGAIQNGVHDFYLSEAGKEDIWTSNAKFTTVWVIEQDIWKVSEVLSYDHNSVVADDAKSDIYQLL